MDLRQIVCRTFNRGALSLGSPTNGVAHIPRPNLIDSIRQSLLDPSIFPLIHGRTGVGKTSALTEAMNEVLRESKGKIGFQRPVVLQASNLAEDFRQTILFVLKEETNIHLPSEPPQTPSGLAELFNSGATAIVFDNFQPVVSRNSRFVAELLDFAKYFCERGSDLGRSKLIVVFAGTPGEVDEMVTGGRWPVDFIQVLPYTRAELEGIVKDGVSKIKLFRPNFEFEARVTQEIAALSFGVPATTHLLARETALSAVSKGRERGIEMDLQAVTENMAAIRRLIRNLTGGMGIVSRLRWLNECECVIVALAGRRVAFGKDDAVEHLSHFFDSGEIRLGFDRVTTPDLFIVKEIMGEQTIELREWLAASAAMLELKGRMAIAPHKGKARLREIYRFLLGLDTGGDEEFIPEFVSVVAEATRFVFDELSIWIDDVCKRIPEETPTTSVVTLPITKAQFTQMDPQALARSINSQVAVTNAEIIEQRVNQVREHYRNIVDLEGKETRLGPLTPTSVNRDIEDEARSILAKSQELVALLTLIYQAKA